MREAIGAAGARLLSLPPDSPEFNPVELAFAELKALLRSSATRAVSDLRAIIRKAFTFFSPEECRTYFKTAGYENKIYDYNRLASEKIRSLFMPRYSSTG